MSNVCIIPARGGSKRIPKKNIKDFLGKPVIAYSIETALASDLFTEVMVSTNSSEIAEVAKRYGATVPFMRSEQNADDYATTMDVLAEVVKSYTDLNKLFDGICCLYPSAPLARAMDLKLGYSKFMEEKCDCVFPVKAFDYPIWRGLRMDSDGAMSYVWPENMNKRSQDLETVYHDAGQWYWMKRSLIENRKGLIGPKTEGRRVSYAMDLHEAHKARLVRMTPPRPAVRQEAQDYAVAQVWPELPPPTPIDTLKGTQHWKVIVREVCAKHSVSVPEILGNQRARHIVLARHEAFHRLSTETTMSLPQIGYRMGGKDHTTVLHGMRAHKKRAGLT